MFIALFFSSLKKKNTLGVDVFILFKLKHSNEYTHFGVCLDLREVGRLNPRLDDAGIDGQDGENDAGQEDQSQLIDVFDADKHHGGHGGEQDGAVHAHVVEQSRFRLCAFQALQGENGRLGYNVDLNEHRCDVINYYYYLV